MDSMENRPLTDAAIQEAAEAAVANNAIAASIQTKEDVIARLQEINQQEESAEKAELDNLKQMFYRLRNAEVEAARKALETLIETVSAYRTQRRSRKPIQGIYERH